MEGREHTRVKKIKKKKERERKEKERGKKKTVTLLFSFFKSLSLLTAFPAVTPLMVVN